MKVEYINPFLESTLEIFKQVCNWNLSKGDLFIKNQPTVPNEIRLIIGITGDIEGNVSFNMKKEFALEIASSMMMGMPVNELDEISRSALCELSNMIAGNCSSKLYKMGKEVNITPPLLMIDNTGKIYQDKTICLPLIYNNNTIEVDISIKEK